MIWVGGCARAYVCACLCIPACLRLRPCLYTHSLTHSQTRMHTQVGPFKERDFVTRVHYRTLADGTLVVANRAERSSKAPVSERYLRMEIMVGGNIIRPIDSDPTRTNFTVCDRCLSLSLSLCLSLSLSLSLCLSLSSLAYLSHNPTYQDPQPRPESLSAPQAKTTLLTVPNVCMSATSYVHIHVPMEIGNKYDYMLIYPRGTMPKAARPRMRHYAAW